jgi:hypothetical protein
MNTFNLSLYLKIADRTKRVKKTAAEEQMSGVNQHLHIKDAKKKILQ